MHLGPMTTVPITSRAQIEKHIAHEHANLLVLPGVFFYRSCSGAVGSGPAAVESAAASVVALTCGVCVLLVIGLDGCEVYVRFVCVVRVPLCVRVSRVSRVCPGSP